MNREVVKEVNNNGKKEQVRGMFNTIAKRYDFLDHVLSLYIDKLWRIRAVRSLKKYNPKIKLCARVYPQDNNTEGFFISKFRKIKN